MDVLPPLLTNDFKVTDGDLYHYSVALSYDDGSPVDGKGIGRKVIEKLQETYDTELAGKDFAYDGEKSLFTVGPLPQNKLEFTVILEDLTSNKAAVNGSPINDSSLEEGDRKRIRQPFQSKSFKVEISYAAKIPIREFTNALLGQESEKSQEALRALDIILRQIATLWRSSLVEKSRQKPQERMSVLSDVLATNNYGVDGLLRAPGVSITEVEGRVLSAPKLKVGEKCLLLAIFIFCCLLQVTAAALSVDVDAIMCMSLWARIIVSLAAVAVAFFLFAFVIGQQNLKALFELIIEELKFKVAVWRWKLSDY